MALYHLGTIDCGVAIIGFQRLSKDVGLEDQVADVLLEFLDLLVLEGLVILRLAAQSVLTAKGKRSSHSSISTTVSPWRQAASATEVSPLRILTARAARGLAVHRSTVRLDCWLMSTSPVGKHDIAALLAQ